MDVSFVRTLNGHDGEVTCIKSSSELSVIVSGSRDGSCIIFDSNKVHFVRSLDGHLGPIVGLDIHPFTVRRSHCLALVSIYAILGRYRRD
jgi:WD40 repeat protein